MTASIEIERMTLAEKLAFMEALWQSLARDPSSVPMPNWQKSLLEERERQIKEGTARFSDWETAKARIQSRTS